MFLTFAKEPKSIQNHIQNEERGCNWKDEEWCNGDICWLLVRWDKQLVTKVLIIYNEA